MTKKLLEDVVRDRCAKYLGFNVTEDGIQQGTGQITTFNQLGIKGNNRKPDGWYLSDNPNDVAIILETKNSDEDIELPKWIEEIKENCTVVLNAGWTKVVGLLHNGYKTKGFFNNQPIDVPDEIQDKCYYIELVQNRVIDKEKIYTLTARINNCLHVEFGVKNLYHRMIFTACALVAERYGAKLKNVKDMGYNVFRNRVFDVLSKSLEKDKKQNSKISIVLDVYSEIRMNIQEKQEAINKFIDCVCEISDCINSNEWRGEDVMGIFFNEFNRYKRKSDSGQIFTPDHITSFMYKLIGVSSNDYVGDFCCGSGAFLVKSMSYMMKAAGGYDTKKAREIRREHLFGIEFDREIFALACANMMIHKDGKTNLEQMDTTSNEACEWIKLKPITKVLMNPPYERKYGCMTIVENVLNSVKAGTDCAFILPDKKLEKESKSKKQIKRILSNHRLTKIIKLPEPLFFGVGVTTSIFVFKAGQPQNDHEIFGCYIEDDGLETVKKQGRQDIRNLWPEKEKYWLSVIRKQSGNDTIQWLKPKEHLSYQMPEEPFEIYEEDFAKTIMDYLMYEQSIDSKKFNEELMNKVLYSSSVSEENGNISITIGKNNE